jgi:Transglycosylase
MSLRAHWPIWLPTTALALAMLYAALCFGLYLLGARHLPAELAPNPYRAPASMRAQFLAVEAPTARSLPRLNPLTWLPHALWDMSGDKRPCDGCRLLLSATWIVSSRDRGARRSLDRHLAEIAASIRIGRNWTRDDAVNTLLAETPFRKGTVGIEAASRFHFGVAAAELRPQESLALIALMKSPSWYDPACHRERFAQRYAHLAEVLGHRGPEWTAAAALTRFRPQVCERR